MQNDIEKNVMHANQLYKRVKAERETKYLKVEMHCGRLSYGSAEVVDDQFCLEVTSLYQC